MLFDAELEVLALLHELERPINHKVKSIFQVDLNSFKARNCKVKCNVSELKQVSTEIVELMVERFKNNRVKPKSTSDKKRTVICEKIKAAQLNYTTNRED